ncbi:uncharacterized protein C8A04DRAFT_12226 [Dichotomopilus funicola]|uniref:Spermatogenesis-associated protein 20-like TRX domain-containing protein n=1 Tax=Dichotomopilus funicola TaxID=1934379 RepID=A0AAN6V2N6_9PEZI|nr:hypothetical protein C8A04DRAFT_12226 [Dichotomopilus funicola]
MMKAQLEQPQGQYNSPAAGSGTSTLPKLKNRAGESDSPYVRLHASTPVAWQPLDADTLARATAENKPIFMHIGFLADHLCRLSTQDSFSHSAIASLLNTSFIPVIIDREERPDLDTIYQNYSEAVNATGGWPLNLFLTPDLYPIFGGTYWPGPGTEHSTDVAAVLGQSGRNKEGISGDGAGEESYNDFLAIAKKIHKFWIEQEERCRREAFEMLHKLQDFAQEGTFGTAQPIDTPPSSNPVSSGSLATVGSTPIQVVDDAGDLDLDQLDEALARIKKMFDPKNYGFGTPKFPNPARLSFLLRLGQSPEEVIGFLGEDEASHAVWMAAQTLRSIRDGSLHDHVGSGFMRFSVTSNWSLPHFEKTVPDNALLLGVFLDAWLGFARLHKKPPTIYDEFADVTLELADYLTSPTIRLENGGFISSEASDSYYRKGDQHMREGAFYTWTRREFDQVVGGDDHAGTVAAAYWDVQEDGNVSRDQDPFDEFINQNILSVKDSTAVLSRVHGMPETEIKNLIDRAREKLRAHREAERPRPARDEKVVVGTNGLVIGALARVGGAILDLDPKKGDQYIQAARDAANFIKKTLWDSTGSTTNPLPRFYYEKASQVRAYADDYAFLIEGLLELYAVTFEGEWLFWAKELQDVQTRLFYDFPTIFSNRKDTSDPSSRQARSGGFYSTELETLSPTILRLKSGMDKSLPSTNAVSALNLFSLGTLLDEEKYNSQAKHTISAFEAEILQYPWLFVSMLAGIVTARLGVTKVVVATGDEDTLRKWYTTPRAETRALVLLKGGKGKEKVPGLDDEADAERNFGKWLGDKLKEGLKIEGEGENGEQKGKGGLK